MNDKIEIQLSRTKISLLLAGAIAFVVLGTMFFLHPEKFQSPIFRNPQTIRITGMVSVALFGICSVFIVSKLFTARVGLTIDEYGITDNSNAASIGLIEWSDITTIETVQVAATKMLRVGTDKPEKYIDRAKNSFAKRAMKANQKMYGSPLFIISQSLKIGHEELEKLIKKEWEKKKGVL